MIQLNAPEGYKFGSLGGACKVTEHDMLPYFDSCQVGVRASQAVLKFRTPLPPTLPAGHGDSERYQFMIEVVNAPCPDGHWIGDVMGATLTCGLSTDGNRWTIEFAEDGTTRWESASTGGYSLDFPYDSAVQDQGADGAADTAPAPVLRMHTRGPRPQFCSPRLPCQVGEDCNEDGVCMVPRPDG